MAAETEKLEHNQREKPISLIGTVVITGLVGGIFWSAVAFLAYFLNFTEIHPNVIIEPWTIGKWKTGWLGTIFSILLMGGIAILAALLYYAALRRFKSMWVGIGYGIALFLLVFFVLNPIFPGINPFTELKRNTIVTSICLYILFGVFVGYSISYEEEEIQKSNKKDRKVST
jgi:hypothetical protein